MRISEQIGTVGAYAVLIATAVFVIWEVAYCLGKVAMPIWAQ